MIRNLRLLNVRKSFLLAGVILFVGFVTIGIGSRRTTVQRENQGILKRLPTSFERWRVRELKVAETEIIQTRVEEMLSFDEVYYREFSHANKILQVYIAYWGPRQKHPRQVADHVPDVCWVSNGWKIAASDYARCLNVAGFKTFPGQFRIFEYNAESLQVLYWHVVGKQLSSYKQGPGVQEMNFLTHLVRGVRGDEAGEQFFVRLSSPQPFADWVDEPLFRNILTTLRPVLEDSAPVNVLSR